ncbi:MAG: flavoprotein [Gemmatimonadales bacterium]|nr:MAG: flavoprotein [Gemmatimonadales bacterium]
MTRSTKDSHRSPLPVAVVGAGPVGLVAAAHLLDRGETPLIFEAGEAVGASIREWGHIRLFSPWKHLTEPVSRRLLETHGWTPPPGDHLPTGWELVRDYLEPLASLPSLAPHLHLGQRVVGITRRGFDKVKSPGRQDAPFELVVRTREGGIQRHLARAVLDASGSWTTPNPVGAGGLPAEGEEAFRDHLRYGVPDIQGEERARYAERRTLVVGSGHSAFHSVLELARLGEGAPGSEVTWAVRGAEPGRMFGGGGRDALPARGKLGERLRALVTEGSVRLVTGFRVARIEGSGDRLHVVGECGTRLDPVDQIIVNTGFRPDLRILRELRIDLDPWLEAPAKLAPLIDPNLHSCGSVPPHGYDTLGHPEQDVFVVGMKSYGRAPTFLLLTGYEQVRSVVRGLTSDLEGARRLELVLPETGVCSSDVLAGTWAPDGVRDGTSDGAPAAVPAAIPANAPRPPTGSACCG